MSKNIIIFISGNGTNLEAIIKATKNKVLKANITGIISNNPKALGNELARKYNIPLLCCQFDRKIQSREEYDLNLSKKLKVLKFDLIVLAGWMHIFTNTFLKQFKNIINLHPALPGQFAGSHAIRDAYKAFKEGKIKETGIMVHRVIEEVDKGETIDTKRVPIFDDDTESDLKKRVQYFEKFLLISSIQKVLKEMSKSYYTIDTSEYKIKKGKVSNVIDIGYDLLYLDHTDRLSAFDKHICYIPNKGTVLNQSSKFWFNKTKHIADNHLVYAKGKGMIVKKCTPFKVEVVVRGYITGNTNTSLWTHYSKGIRNYCGITFPDGLVKNQKIDTVITPTTKGIKDIPISAEEIVKRKLMTQYEWNDVREKAKELFKFGQEYASKKGLLLVDTKYEFGKDKNGKILLIDEIHTCDSSRFWLKDTYETKFFMGENPDTLDKDGIRNYVKNTCDPYNDVVPEVPVDIINKVSGAYMKFYKMLTGNNVLFKEEFDIEKYFSNYHSELPVILSGSETDREFVDKITKELKKQNIYSHRYVSSAHKNTQDVLNILDKYERRCGKIVWITVAGRSNALSGVVAANSKYPVIACPPFKDKLDMMVNINSSIQCPSKVPVMTILEPLNVALAIKSIFNLE